MGLGKGEKIEKLCQIRVTDVREEPLNSITKDDCIKEGFPELSPDEFVEMFTQHMRCAATDRVTRIEFEYI